LGYPFPLDKNHVTYVWFDALINYYTSTREKGREEFWGEATSHLLGKDNTWFHAVYWPAMLKSAGIDLPKTTFNHGFISVEGQKISKSLGNTISPIILVEKYGADSVRYFCLRQFPFATGEDGDFSEAALVNRHNDELANKLGNLVSRTSTLAEKYGIEKFEDQEFEKTHLSEGLVIKVTELINNYELDKTLNEIFAFIDRLNEYVQGKKPWENNNRPDRLEVNKGVLYNLIQGIKTAATLLSPFIPEASEKIAKHFDFKISLDEIGKPLKNLKIKKAPILFKKIEQSKKKSESPQPKIISSKPNKQQIPNKTMENITTINFEDFTKLDLRVAEIANAENIEGADKLYKLSLDVGELGERTICAGIKEFYSADDLKNKKVIIIANLKPRKLRGIESCGMLLAASNSDHTKVSLISPDQDMEPGNTVG